MRHAEIGAGVGRDDAGGAGRQRPDPEHPGFKLLDVEQVVRAVLPDAELAARSSESFPTPQRGYARLYREEVLQADLGCDLDFLRHTPARPRRRS